MAQDKEPLVYLYRFRLSDVRTEEFEVRLDPDTLDIIAEKNPKPPEWTSLAFDACEFCPLDTAKTKHCPIAVNTAGLVEAFQNIPSTQTATIEVEAGGRKISKFGPVQNGLFSLFGIYMVASGCPVMGQLKPMVRFHLPFASVEETAYRVVSMYLMAQYHRMKAGLTPDWDLKGLYKLYQEINKVNRAFSRKLLKASGQEAAVNAIVHLDVFAQFIQRFSPDLLQSLARQFSVFLKHPE